MPIARWFLEAPTIRQFLLFGQPRGQSDDICHNQYAVRLKVLYARSMDASDVRFAMGYVSECTFFKRVSKRNYSITKKLYWWNNF